MPKGGARVASDKFAVSKAMGFEYFYETLNFLNENKDDLFEINEILKELNKKFAYWDPSRNETCRGTLKELWRVNFVNQHNKSTNKKNDINEQSWNGKSILYKISDLGKKVISEGKEFFFINFAENLLKSKNRGHFPQLDKIFSITQSNGKFPVNNDEHVKLSKSLNKYVELHAGKSIKYGLLETTGIFHRKEKNYFYLNNDWISKLNNLEIGKINFDNEKINLISIKNINRSLKINDEITIEYIFKNSSEIDIEFNFNTKFFGSFDKIFKIKNKKEKIKIPKKTDHKISLTLLSNTDDKDFTDSMISSCMGYIELSSNEGTINFKLPNIRILNDDHEWELKICDLFKKVNFETIHLSGKSDRPDAIIDLSGSINRNDLLKYIRSNKVKLMMETTLNKYTFSKLQNDIKKFQRHSEKVLKINSLGQIIVADYFQNNIEEKFNRIKSDYNHIITLIDKASIKYLEKFRNEIDFKNKAIKLFKSRKLVTKKLIDSKF